MKAPLSHNFKQPNTSQSQGQSNIIGGQSGSQQNNQIRRLHQRSLANQQKPTPSYNNEDIFSPPSVENIGAASSSNQSHRIQSAGSIGSGQMDINQIGRQQRPATATNFVMSQSYGLGGRDLQAQRRTPTLAQQSSISGSGSIAHSNDDLYPQKNQQPHYQSKTTSILSQTSYPAVLQNSSEQKRQQPYQWPQVNYNSKKILDFSSQSLSANPGPYYSTNQNNLRSSSQSGIGSNIRPNAGANFGRRDSHQASFDHYQQTPGISGQGSLFQTLIPHHQQHQMLSAKKLPEAISGSGQVSPIQENNFYYTSASATDPRTRVGTNSQPRTQSQTRGQMIDTTIGKTNPQMRIRQENSSPLRASGSHITNYNDTQSTQLRASQKLEAQLKSAFGTLSTQGPPNYQNNQLKNSSNTSTINNNQQQYHRKTMMMMSNQKNTIQRDNLFDMRQGGNTIQEPENLRTPPVAQYDEGDDIGLRMRDLEEPNQQPLGAHSSQEEFEQMVLRMHSKMKNLESRYLDLANFYKRELLANGNTSSALNNSRFSALGREGGDITPYLAQAEVQPNKPDEEAPPQNESLQLQQPFDQNVEKELISDLLRQKNDLEKDLQDMMQYQFRSSGSVINELDESEVNIEGRLKNQQLHFQRERSLEEIQNKVGSLLTQFQDDFLEFINRNYQSFTENDVLDMFSELRSNIDNILSSIANMPLTLSNKSAIKRALSSYHSDLQESLKAAISEYELNSGYTIQAVKKTAFQLQSKHGTAQLDSKKAQIALQAIYKKCGLLHDSFQFNSSSLERSPPGMNRRGNSQTRGASIATQPPPLSPSSQLSANQQQRLIFEIQGQVQVLTQSLYSISDKMAASEEDLRYLMNDLEDEHQLQINKYKVNLEQLLNDLLIQTLNKPDVLIGSLSSPTSAIRDNFVNESFDNQTAFNQQLQDLNNNLQSDLQLAQAEIVQLKTQLQHTNSHLALNRVVSFGANQQSTQMLHSTQQAQNEVALLSDQLAQFEDENAFLQQQIRNLTRQVDEKALQADRLAQELTQAQNSSAAIVERSRERSKERVNLEQIQFYQKKYDDALRQTRDLVKLTQRFLTSMKKLQKAVHRKEQNVSQEKQEFEDARKDLETRLKDVKREIDQLIAPGNLNNQVRKNHSSETGSDSFSNVDARINRYQNKAPQTFADHNQGSNIRHSALEQYTRFSQLHQQQSNKRLQNPYQQQQHQQISSNSNIVYNDNNDPPQRQRSAGGSNSKNSRISLSRDKYSPNMLRPTSIQQQSRNNMYQNQRDNMFRSIDAVDRHRHQTLLQQSAPKQFQPHHPTASSAHKPTSADARSHHSTSQKRFPLQQQQQQQQQVHQSDNPLLIDQQQQQLLLRSDMNGLREDISRLRQERDQLLDKLNAAENDRLRYEQEVVRVNEERQQLEIDLDAALQQMQEKQGEGFNDGEQQNHDLEALNQEVQRLRQEIEARDQAIHEQQKKSKSQEESHQKQIGQIKERGHAKDLEIGQLRKTLSELQASYQTELREELLTLINHTSQDCTYKLQELELLLQTKDQQLTKLQRTLEKRFHNNSNSQTDQLQYKEKIKILQQNYQEMEARAQELQEQLAQTEENLNNLNQAHNEELQRLSQEHEEAIIRVQDEQYQGQSQEFRVELENIQSQNNQQIANLKHEHQKHFEKLKADYQARLDQALLDTQNQHKAFQTQISSLQTQLSQKQASLDSSQSQLASQSLTLQLTSTQLDSLNSDLQHKSTSLTALESQLAASHLSNAQTLAQVEQLQAELKGYLSSIERLNLQAAEAKKGEGDKELSRMQRMQEELELKEERLQESHKRLKEVEMQLKESKEMVEETECRLMKETQGHMQEKERQIEQSKRQLQETEGRLEEAEQAFTEAEGIINEVQIENQKYQNQIRETLQQARDSQTESQQVINQLNDQFNEVSNERDQALNRIQELEFLINQSNDELQTSQLTLQDTLQKLTSLQQNFDLQAKNFVALNQESQILKQQLDQQKTLSTHLQSHLDSLQAQYDHLLADKEGTMTASQQEQLHLQQELAALKLQAQRLDSELAGKKEEVQEKNRVVEGKVKEVQDREGEIQGLQEQMGQLNQELQSRRSLIDTLNARLTQKDLDLEALKKTQINDLQSLKQTHEQELESLKVLHNQDLEQQLAAQHETLLEQHQAELSHHQTSINQYIAQINSLNSKLETLNLQLKQAQDQIQRLQSDTLNSEQSKVATIELMKLEIERVKNEKEIMEQNLGQEIEQIKGQQISELQIQIQSINENHQIAVNAEQAKVQEANAQLDNALEELQSAADQIQTLQDQLSTVQEQLTQAQDSVSQLEKTLEELHQQLQTLQQENSELQQRFTQLTRELQGSQDDLQRRDQLIVSLQQEKQQAIDQVKELIDQSTIEKQSLEEILRSQLAQAMENVQEKDKAVQEQSRQIEELQRNLRDSQSAVEELAERTSLAEQAFEQQDQELQARDAMLSEHQQTLAKNRDLIVMLKDEYKKVSDKERGLQVAQKELIEVNERMKEKEQELTTQVVELTEQVEALTDQVQRLKQEFAQKNEEAKTAQANLLDALNNKTEEIPQQNINNNTTFLRNLEDELKAKDELIEEANRYIEEFNDEKHELKAKFKHLMQILEDPSLLPEDESSYKEDDELDIGQAFDQLEAHLRSSKKRVDARLQSIADENSRLKDDLDQREEELRSALDQAALVNTEVKRMKEVVEENDKEMRRQMENAAKKIDKYKLKVNEGLDQIEDLKLQLEVANQQAAQQMIQTPPPQQQQQQEQHDDQDTLMLLQKLQKAETELQQLRSQQQQQQFAQGRVSDLNNQSKLIDEELHQSFKLDAQRVQQMEEQLVNLRRQLFEAKDQVIDNISEAFSKKLKEQQRIYTNEQVLKGKLSELKNNLEATLNNNVKAVKVVRFITTSSNKEENKTTQMKRLLIVQVLSNNECYVLDEAKLSETALAYVRSYLPEAFEEEERQSLTAEPQYLKEIQKLEEQIREIREDRLSLHQELQLHKDKFKNLNNSSCDLQDNQQQQHLDLRGVELEEEVTHLTSENLELRDKLKQLSQLNKLQQQRLIDLNELVKDLLEGDENSKLAKLKEECEMLKRQISGERKKRNKEQEEPPFEDNSFLEGIQVAENIDVLSPKQDNNNNLFDQSSMLLEDFGVQLGGDRGTPLPYQQKGGDINDPNNLQLPGMNPAGNYSDNPILVVEKLQRENDELKQKLQQSVQNAGNNASSVLNSTEGMGLIKHIKGTLLQFLKNCPVTDRNNEELLTIVFSMMEFTREEIQEVQDYRQLKGAKQQQVRGSSVSSGGAATGGGGLGTDPGDDELRKRTSKGLFSMFRKGSRDKRGGGKDEDSNSSLSGVTPTKGSGGQIMTPAPIGRR